MLPDSKSQPPVFSLRGIEVHDVPLNLNVAMLHPENVVLRYGVKTIDIGSLCYLRRSEKPRKNSNNGTVHPRMVDLTSIDTERREQVQSLITFASEWVTSGGYRLVTAFDHFKQFSRFVDWADQVGYPDAMSGSDATYASFRAYVADLRERVNQNKLGERTATDYQWNTHLILSHWLGLHDLHRGINMLAALKRNRIRTEPAAEDDLGRLESLCEALFIGLSDLVLTPKSYPHWLPMPKYLGWAEDGVWVFPAPIWCLPPHQRDKESEYFIKHSPIYDYAKGRLRAPEEIRQHYKTMAFTRFFIKRTQRKLDKANEDAYSFFRGRAGMVAHNAFVFLFLGQTGMNTAVAIDLPWGETYEVGTAQQGFRQIKWRAGGKWYPAVVRSKFLPLFARFMELRKYLLNGSACDTLFFSLGTHRKDGPSRMDAKRFDQYYKTLRKFDPSLSKISPRVLRATKDDYHLRHDDLSITSKIMGRSEETTRTKYAAGSKTTHYNEMGDFLDGVKQASINKTVVLNNGVVIPNGTDGHIGTCTRLNIPNPIADKVPIQPDCTKQEGCLFCDKHRVHADEKDTRKLVSCAFVVEQVIYVPGAEKYFRPVLGRIESILDEIKGREPGNVEMVKQVTESVEEGGDLDPYWAAKLAVLESLEFTL